MAIVCPRCERSLITSPHSYTTYYEVGQPQQGKGRLELPRVNTTIPFNGMLNHSLRWAHLEGLLPGQAARRLQHFHV